jgi:superfamily II DNA or RNA helicase
LQDRTGSRHFEMSQIDLTEAFLAKIAGWEAVKQARGLLERGQVLSSNWSPPILKGVVQEGATSYRAGLAIKDSIDIENMCGCRASRQWGTICSHSVAVGLHHIRRNHLISSPLIPAPRAAQQPSTATPTAPQNRVQRAGGADAGVPAEIHLILPPNFLEAAAKGKIMLCLEAQWQRGRTPLNALPKSVAFQFSTQDVFLLDQIESLAAGETPGMMMLSTADFSTLLPRLARHPRVSVGKSKPVEILDSPAPLALRANLEPAGEIRLSLKPGTPLPTLIPGEKIWTYLDYQFRPLALPPACQSILSGPLLLTRAQVPRFLSQDWPALESSNLVEANFKLEDFEFAPRAPRFLLHLAGGLAQLQAQLQCAYGPRIMTVGVTSKDESFWLPDPDSPTRYASRDPGAEQAALGRLLRCGFTGPDSHGRYQSLGQDKVLNFFAREYPRLEKEWEVTLEERLDNSTAKNLDRIEPQFQITPSGEQWFDCEVTYATASGERFSTADIQRLLRSGQTHARLRDGRFALIDTGAVEELQEVLLDCSPQQHEGKYRIPNQQAGFLVSSLRQQEDWQLRAPSTWMESAGRQTGETRLEPPPLRELDPILRSYQKTGVAWFHFLRQNQFGGILADEMGLGKTLQTLAFLRTVLESRSAQPGAAPLPNLVVCPTSLVFNWAAEAKKFTPTLRVLALQGAQRRNLFGRIPQADLVITSYALIRRDADVYREIQFDTVILDEAQHIKNRQTQNAQSVKTIRSHHRLVLTGTPMENSVLDLWSIYDFLMPGYLGAAKDFRERYEIPITREKDSQAQNRLARRVRPFLLRRLKREVARDLPEKIEQVSFCELTEDQRGLYQQLLQSSRQEILNSVGAQGLQKSRMVILNALLRLRQICCDLRLLNLENINPDTASGKLDLFSELLQEVLDGGHRVLVFSQFVRMLTLLRQKLEAEGVDYSYLDGSTPNRPEVVEQFQNNERIPVFLISLKAGGVGLNLTGADTVIHFDPWWNPAVEDQATDRAHRIGQNRVVTSYKLITRDTVEEKILHLQSRKRSLIQGTLGEEQFAGALTWEEIQDLLSEGE